MTRSIPISVRPWYLRTPMLVALLVLAAGILGVGWLVLTRVITPPGSATGHTPIISYTTSQGDNATEGTVNSPLRVNMRIPWSNGSADTAIASVSLQMVDDAGKPARLGDSESRPEAMNPALEIGVWVYNGSVPSAPGSYHPQVKIDALNGTSESFDLVQPALSAKPDTPWPAGGYVFARNSNLWLMSADATRERRLTYYEPYYELAENPAWAPDGKSIAYAYSPKTAPDALPYTDIWSVGPDGTGGHVLAEHGPNESLVQPTWSADGKSLYFAVQSASNETATVDPLGLTSDNWRVDRLDLATGERTPWQPNALMPAIGGPAHSIAYIERVVTPNQDIAAQGVDRVMIADAAGAQPRQLVSEKEYQAIQDPHISPDGKWVVFAAINVPPSGSVVPPMVHGPSSIVSSLLDWLLMTPQTASAHGLPWDLFIVPTAGGKSVRLTELNEDQPAPVWLDNSTIAFMGTTGLYKLAIGDNGAAVGQPTRIHDGAPHGGLAWHDK